MSTGSGITITFSTNPITVEMQPGGDVGTDQLVKFDANDPTAGYLSDKIIAGTGITLSEGTGADENKVKVTFSGTIPDQLSDLSDDATHRLVTDTEKSTWNSKKASTYKGAYDAEIVSSPTSGTLTLKNSTETVLETALTNSNAFTVALPTPTAGQVNESILIFSCGSTLPTITQPVGIVWRGTAPTLAINKSYTIAYEQINTTGTTFVIWTTGVQNT